MIFPARGPRITRRPSQPPPSVLPSSFPPRSWNLKPETFLCRRVNPRVRQSFVLKEMAVFLSRLALLGAGHRALAQSSLTVSMAWEHDNPWIASSVFDVSIETRPGAQIKADVPPCWCSLTAADTVRRYHGIRNWMPHHCRPGRLHHPNTLHADAGIVVRALHDHPPWQD